MAIAFLFEEVGLTQEQYEAVVGEANAQGPPIGNIIHMAGPTDVGWRIVDVWESQAAGEAFYSSDRFQQALQRVGRGMPQPTIWPLQVLNK
jgi:hypothetical protein